MNSKGDAYDKYGTIFHTFIIERTNLIFFQAYLNEKNVEEVRNLPDISYASIPIEVSYDENKNWFLKDKEKEEEEIICFEVNNVDDESIGDEAESTTTTTEIVATATPEPVEQEQPEEPKKNNIICEKKNKKETFYEIFSKYPKGDIVEDDPVYIEFVNNFIENVHDVIVKTRKTYQNPKELDRLQEAYPKLNSIGNAYDKYGTIFQTSIIQRTNMIFFKAYLNEKNVEEVKKLPDIFYVAVPIEWSYDENKNWFSNDKEKEEEETICFEVDDVDDEDDTSSTSEAQCFSIALGYQCCSSGAKVYYVDSDGEWGYENDNWCGISN